MSSIPPPTGYVTVQYPPRNTIGLIGFILSVASCGLLSPISLILSLIGLTKRPRGFAIAGTITSLLGLALLGLAGFVLWMGIFGFRTAVDYVKTWDAGHKASKVIESAQTESGSVPTEAEGTTLIQSYSDAWGVPLKYSVTGDTYTITSAGVDKQFGTDDDLEMKESELTNPNNQWPAPPAVPPANGGIPVEVQ